MNPNYPSTVPLTSLNISLGSLPKQIQVVEPISTACSIPITPISDQTACLNPLIMTAPISSPMVTFLGTGSTLSIPQASTSLVNSVSSNKPGLVSSSPCVYQSIPLGQQIFLANTAQNGFVIAQPPGTSYVIAQPQFQVRTPSGAQTIPMALVLGTQPASGLIRLPQQSATANVIPTANPSIVCANPAIAIRSNLAPSSFPQILPGVAVARFPNGCHIAPNATPASVSTAKVSTTNATTVNSTPLVTASTVVESSTSTRPTIATPESVLLELNKEINNLEKLAATSTAPLTLQHSNRLRRLLQARDQVLRTIENTKYRSPGTAIRSCASPAANAILRPRPPSTTPTSFISAARSDVINLLVKHRLLPMNLATAAGESVLVEFRLTSQRYQLWLTRTQKVNLEQLLHTLPTNQRKTEVLVVFQQEQASFFAAHPRPLPPVAAQLRLLRPPPPSQSQSASQQQPWVSQQTVQPSRQPLPSGTMRVLAPVSAVSTPSDFTKSSLSLKVPLFVQATGVDVPASSPSSVPATTPGTSANLLANQLSAQQSRRLNAVRNLLHADQLAAVSRPPVLAEGEDRPSPSPEELLILLAPYHVQQDLDNTPEALVKVDSILDKAFHQLFTRKRQTEDAVNSILCSEKWQLMDYSMADRLSLTRIALENDRECLAAEREAFEKLKARMDAEECHPLPPKLIRQFLEESAPNFFPLEFDEKGNSRPALLHLEEQQPKLKAEKAKALTKDILKTSAKCKNSVEDGAWPEWEEGMDFQPPSSPGVDIANVIIDEEELVVNNFDISESRSPLNGLSMVRRLLDDFTPTSEIFVSGPFLLLVLGLPRGVRFHAGVAKISIGDY